MRCRQRFDQGFSKSDRLWSRRRTAAPVGNGGGAGRDGPAGLGRGLARGASTPPEASSVPETPEVT